MPLTIGPKKKDDLYRSRMARAGERYGDHDDPSVYHTGFYANPVSRFARAGRRVLRKAFDPIPRRSPQALHEHNKLANKIPL